MAATVTLSTTTLANRLLAGSDEVKLASTTGVIPGLRLYVDGELLTVVRLLVNPWVQVLRGVDGTPTGPHMNGSTVYIGRADQFYSQDPTGRPHDAVPVAPWINVTNGTIWYAQGDDVPAPGAVRWWQKQTTTWDTGSLGVRTVTVTPSSSS